MQEGGEVAAQRYAASSHFFWNSGMFMFRADRYLEELGRYRPDILDACRTAFERAHVDLDFLRLDHDAFAACPADSIDYALTSAAAT